ncbi:hypothetical protein K450DRAFT_261256 [Umbelopsis ramanniana AG]|uniref:Uncharacterized protein n=1 Tax=Umbelopsis ramanniana AG TaxID=1314678 RepID=A0AAD5H841_UMBRA|nr:uncharacterized protein K450DRAFT_261256 [Umbelopsis ramanniana AG]KAI8575565.1 hypothetical protein K450DRAFT_261256 [Umbelopsis ramanniana AG]
MQLKFIVSTLATVRELEVHSKGILNQLADAIDVTSKKIPKSSFYLDILIPQISNTLEADTRMNPSTAIWLLDRFIDCAARDAISLHELSRILDLLKSPTLSKILLNEERYMESAANILDCAILHCIETTHEPLSEENRYKIVLVALQLMALCSMSGKDIAMGVQQDKVTIIDSVNTKEKLVKTVMMLHGTSQKPEDVFVQYLPYFLETIAKPRGNAPEKWNDESISLRMLEVIIMESRHKVIESSDTVNKIVNVLVKCGSQQPDGKNGRDTDSSVIGARLRCLAVMTWLYNMDKDTLYIKEQSCIILKEMIALCIVSSEPQNGSCALNIQHQLRRQAIVCLTTALETQSITPGDDQQGFILDIITKCLQDEDEQTRVLSVSAMTAFIKQHNKMDGKFSAELEKHCLHNLLSRLKDQKQTVCLSLYNQLSAIFNTISNEGIYVIIDALVSQIEYVDESSDRQLKTAFIDCLDALYSLNSTRLMEAIRDAQQVSTEPDAYQMHIDRLASL